MEETLRQLTELFVRSIPTVVLFLIVYAGYHFIVHRPLVRVLQERHDRGEGAIEKARADVSAAEAKAAEYEQQLREAQLAVYKAQEARRQRALQARSEAMQQARQEAHARVLTAKADLERDVEQAKGGLRVDAERLATQIIDRVLTPVALAGGAQ